MALIESASLVKAYAQARVSRDARFDGVFFTAVKTTGIYCRSICPANTPLEKNVEYYDSAISAANAGFRPCLRCRPDSAPQSNPWLGTQTTLQRALDLIHAGALQTASLENLAERLGITSRYLRRLFEQKLGVSPKQYSIYQQCLFAKQLLHETDMPVIDIAFSSGFSSVRQFNTAIKSRLKLTPTQIRRNHKEKSHKEKQQTADNTMTLVLYFRPPYAWSKMLDFLSQRVINGLEWTDEYCYGRVFEYENAKGFFTIGLGKKPHSMQVSIMVDDISKLYFIVQTIRNLFDLDAPIHIIDEQLQDEFGDVIEYLPGLRLPGVWSAFEAGVRAILGQQVSVQQAHKLVTVLVESLGEPIDFSSNGLANKATRVFPKPEKLAQSELDFFRMPQARKDTLRRFAQYFIDHPNRDNDSAAIDEWLSLKGIGPWTVNYVKLRAVKDPDVWLCGDAGVNNALKKIKQTHPDHIVNVDAASPWRSYLVFHLWNQL